MREPEQDIDRELSEAVWMLKGIREEMLIWSCGNPTDYELWMAMGCADAAIAKLESTYGALFDPM